MICFFDQKKNYSRGINNVKITDTVNKVIATGHYAELYRNIETKKRFNGFNKKSVDQNIS